MSTSLISFSSGPWVVARGLRLGILLALLAGAAATASAQYIAPMVCVEYIPGSNNYVARFSYILSGTSTSGYYVPINSPGNFIEPIGSTPGLPDSFAAGTNSAFSMLLPLTSKELWFLGQPGYAQAVTIGYYDTAATQLSQSAATTSLVTPTCPVSLLAASLNYSAPGTHNNVFLAQVNSGPPAAGVTVAGFSTQPGITISNLTYVPADAANPTGNLNPNSIYGTVTIATPNASTTPALLMLSQNGTELAEALLPIAYSGQIVVPNVVGMTQSTASGSLSGAGLVTGTITTQASSTVASGFVISQSPAPGADANANSAVNLVVSTGLAPPVSLTNTTSISGSAAAGYVVTVTVKNTGQGTVNGITLNAVTLGAAAGVNLPMASAGPVAPGGLAVFSVSVPGSAGADGSGVKLTYAGTAAGGTFSGSLRSTLLP